MNGGQNCYRAGGVSRRTLLAAATTLVPVAATSCAISAPPTPSAPPAASVPPGPNQIDAGVRFHTAGSTFNPAIELVEGSGARVDWFDEAGTRLAQGPAPTIDFGSTETRTVVMVTNYADVVTVNLGFNTYDDAGRYNIGPTFNKKAENVTAVEGLAALTNLRRFLAASTPLAGTLDLAGLARLEFVECYFAPVTSVNLDGCQSLIRLCLEQSALGQLDLNPVAATLRDLRAAKQAGGRLEIVPLSQPLTRLYHFCVRDQTVGGHPTSEQLPACEELWNWNTGQSGELPTPQRAVSVMARSNQYTSADFTGQWTGDGGGELDLESNKLTVIGLQGCRALRSIRLRWNNLPTRVVDDVLAEVASWQSKGVTLLLDGNEAPTAEGLAHVAALRALGWEVEVSSP